MECNELYKVTQSFATKEEVISDYVRNRYNFLARRYNQNIVKVTNFFAVMLWDFEVGESRLKDHHKQGLINLERTFGKEFSIISFIGRTSVTGSLENQNYDNHQLALDRINSVKYWLDVFYQSGDISYNIEPSEEDKILGPYCNIQEAELENPVNRSVEIYISYTTEYIDSDPEAPTNNWAISLDWLIKAGTTNAAISSISGILYKLDDNDNVYASKDITIELAAGGFEYSLPIEISKSITLPSKFNTLNDIPRNWEDFDRLMVGL